MNAITDLDFDNYENDLALHMISHFEDRHDAEVLLLEVQYERIEWSDYYKAL